TGTAFRFQPAGAGLAHPREFRQAGIEQIGHRPGVTPERADAECLAIVLDALAAAGLSPSRLAITAGDLALAQAILAAVDMPARWRRRLAGLHGRPAAFRAELARLSVTPGSQAEHLPLALLDQLAATHDTPTAAADRLAIVTAHLEAERLEVQGARSLEDLAASLAALARDAVARPLDPHATAVIERYASISCPLADLAAKLTRLAADTGIDIARAIASVEVRIRELRATGADPARIAFSGEFGRSLAYYTGFVFEIGLPGEPRTSPIAGGGRYDGLMRACGAPADVPAVGAAIHTERLLAALAGGRP
ncbi:MAG: ATP phosphoribosyltransferase regulatory subunit, partial [Thermoleophilia bacterium]|nr:ATP phosphoribosyltransferase regulatory subunit [Thermoleophilia bacterium]